MSAIRDAATALIRRNIAITPIPAGTKSPYLKDWQNLRLTAADVSAHFQNGQNIGVLLGTPSGGLVDVDLDTKEAIQCAPEFLPQTGMMHGRKSKPRSHWWYRVTDAPGTTKRFKDETNNATLAELRSTGGQTVVPPSVHPSGETFAWVSEGEPTQVDCASLARAVALVATCALIARNWPPEAGSRHDLSLALSGFLLRHGIEVETVRKLIISAAKAAGDEEWRDREDNVYTSAKRLQGDKPTTGGKTLIKSWKNGAEILSRISDWLELPSEETKAPPQAPAVPTETIKEKAQAILDLEDPLIPVRAEFAKQGYGGDLNPPVIVYLAASTRLLEHRLGSSPCHLLILAASGAGKSYTEKIVRRLLPEEAYHEISAGSARALIYDKADLKHRVVIFGEADSLPSDEDNTGASAIRNLLQDGELSYDVVVKDAEGKGYSTQHIRRPGPSMFITTSTRRFRDSQMGTRVFELEVPEDRAKIKAALKTQATLTNEPAPPVTQAIVDFQHYLQRLAPWDVVIPFADRLAEIIGNTLHRTRVMRDFTKLLSLIKAVAVIRHTHRDRDPRGRVIATVADYQTVRDLVGPLYESASTGATQGVRDVWNAVQAGAKKSTDIQKALGTDVSRASIHRWVSSALSNEWLINNETRPKKPFDLSIGQPIPDRVGLPSCEAIWGSVSLPGVLPEDNVGNGKEASETGHALSCGKEAGSETAGFLDRNITGLRLSHFSGSIQAPMRHETAEAPKEGLSHPLKQPVRQTVRQLGQDFTSSTQTDDPLDGDRV